MIVRSKEASRDAIILLKNADITANGKEPATIRKEMKNDIFQDTSEKSDASISAKMILEAIERANRAISGANRRFEYSFHDKTNEVIVKVIDSESNEVIREIPPKKILDLVASLMEIAGIIVDERR